MVGVSVSYGPRICFAKGLHDTQRFAMGRKSPGAKARLDLRKERDIKIMLSANSPQDHNHWLLFVSRLFDWKCILKYAK